jgi:hypothetical protein
VSAELLVAVAGLALLDAFNPATILAVALILLLPGEQRAAKATTFVAGAYLTVLVGGATVFLAADTAVAAAAGGLVWVRRIAFGLAALAVLRAAIRRRRRHRRAAIALPSWLTTTTAAPFGVLVTGADLPNAFPYFIAIERLASSAVTTSTALLVLAGYALLYCLPCLLLLVINAVHGERVRAHLDRLHRRFGTARDVPASMPAALGLAILATLLAGVATTA